MFDLKRCPQAGGELNKWVVQEGAYIAMNQKLEAQTAHHDEL
jgi:hypothetical protein